MLDPRERFGATADAYHRHRPSCPSALVDWFLEAVSLTPPAGVADVGCGTGISTRLFAARGFDTLAIDPNEEMLNSATGPSPLAGGLIGLSDPSLQDL